ncbi:MAG: TonB-dependent receptor [bacterium]
MDANGSTPSTRQKAWQLNTTPLIFGTIAEIGAGQEVARQFFRAGKASATVAKTVSAYDMQMSDAMYGVEQSGRYVTRSRLENILDTEYAEIVLRVAGSRSSDSTFFAFGDTVAAKSYKSDKDCHGWMGIRFQHASGAEPSQIVLHVRMLDQTNRDQQESLGILGVNLIHGAFTHSAQPEALVDGLVDNLVWGRIEVDFIHFEGPAFRDVDNRLLNLRLVTSSLSPVVMFSPEGCAVMPADLLFKRHVLVLRGTFRPFTPVQADMIRCGLEVFARDLATSPRNVVCFCEMNVARYLSHGVDEVYDLEERVVRLAELGYHVMVTSHLRYFRLSEYFTLHDKRRIGLVLSVDNVRTILDDKYYDSMHGGILEAMGKLFTSDTKLLVYPNLVPGRAEIITAENLEVPEHQRYLYQHLVHNGRILSLEPDAAALVPFDPRVATND